MAQFHPYITNAALTVTGRRLSEDENGKSVPGWRERSHAANLGVTPHDGYRKPLDGRREPRWRGLPQWRGASRQVVACPLSPFFGRAIADAVGEGEEPACQGYNDHDEHHGPETGRQSRPRERPCAEYDDERRKDEFSEQTLAKPRFLTHERSPPLLTI